MRTQFFRLRIRNVLDSHEHTGRLALRIACKTEDRGLIPARILSIVRTPFLLDEAYTWSKNAGDIVLVEFLVSIS